MSSVTARTPRTRAGDWIPRPAPDADPRGLSRHSLVGLVLAAAGALVVLIATIGNLTAAADLGVDGTVASTLAWTFAVTTTGFGLAKLGIGIVLVGIVIRLWHRANAVSWSVERLRPEPGGPAASTPPELGRRGVQTGTGVPPLLRVHRMARRLWLPMLAMGAMAVAAGLVLGLITADAQAGTPSFRNFSAWTQGTMFLGEGLLLSGIAMLLGTIMANLRTAGAEVQDSLGVPVQTLRMPTAAKAFVALMMTGLMMVLAQFAGYLVAASRAGEPASYAELTTWLGPFRETALGVILVGIVLALVAIGDALDFQFGRVKEILTTGR